MKRCIALSTVGAPQHKGSSTRILLHSCIQYAYLIGVLAGRGAARIRSDLHAGMASCLRVEEAGVPDLRADLFTVLDHLVDQSVAVVILDALTHLAATLKAPN